ncbi:unnamed protein product [Ostreobium quekettii]|uniref:Uncharacterized protein n=1 Tax=Ostreobium quekettii TaxID=121088 RepID=A0A8S1IVI4_9CHLO|nr:unnamed protein product [Ostreobium quekettii]
MATWGPWLPGCVCPGTGGHRRASAGLKRRAGWPGFTHRRAIAKEGPLEWKEASDGSAAQGSLEDLPLPEGDTGGWPIIGRTLDFLKDQHTFMADHVKKYGLVSRANLLGRNAAIIAGSDNLHKIMTKDTTLLNQRLMKDLQLLAGPNSFWNKDVISRMHYMERKFH